MEIVAVLLLWNPKKKAVEEVRAPLSKIWDLMVTADKKRSDGICEVGRFTYVKDTGELGATTW